MNLIHDYPKSCLAGVALLWAASSIRPVVPTQQPLHLTYVETPSTYVPIDPKQLDCLAANIYYEGRNQPALGQLAIGLTTLVRARESKWPKSICSVVHQPKQFSWVGKTGQQPKWDHLAYLRSVALSNRILSGDFDNLLPLFSPTYFHTSKVNPKWSQHMTKLAVINDHIFYE